MLRLQRKNIRNKIVAWLQLLGFSLGAHVCFLGLIFFVYNGNLSSQVFHVNKQLFVEGVPIIVVAHMQESRPKNAVYSSQKKIAAKPKKVVQKPKAPTPVAKVVEPVQAAQPVQQSSVNKTVLAQKEVAKKPTKKIDPVQKKSEPTLIAQKVPAPIVQPKIEKEKKSVSKDSTQPQKVVGKVPVVVSEVLSSKEHSPEEHSQAIVVNSYKEKVALTKQFAFERALTQAWHPPVGIRERSCTLKVHAACDGSVRAIDTIKSSGLMMYDAQARSAIFSLAMPSDVWDSIFEVTFEC
jgi:hypothetical protein